MSEASRNRDRKIRGWRLPGVGYRISGAEDPHPQLAQRQLQQGLEVPVVEADRLPAALERAVKVAPELGVERGRYQGAGDVGQRSAAVAQGYELDAGLVPDIGLIAEDN